MKEIGLKCLILQCNWERGNPGGGRESEKVKAHKYTSMNISKYANNKRGDREKEASLRLN